MRFNYNTFAVAFVKPCMVWWCHKIKH